MSTEKIKIIYEENKGNRGADLFTPFLFILITVSIFSQLYTTVQRQLLHKKIDDKKCSPKYLFFSGFLNPLNKDPISTTQSNFTKCVAKNIYQDAELSRDIKKNEYLIKKNKMNLEETLNDGKTIIRDIKGEWTQALQSKQNDLNKVSEDKDKLFRQQETLYEEVSRKTTQLFNVIQAIIIYVGGILQLKVSEHKTTLKIDLTHNSFMQRYMANFTKYNKSYDSLRDEDWRTAINVAREAIVEYENMTEEIDDFMKKNAYIVGEITSNCYQLKYNMDNDSCGTVFPNINQELIAHYPYLKTIF